MAETKLVEISRIDLDQDNPRIKHLTAIYDEVTEPRMKLALGAGGDAEDDTTAQDKFLQLKRAIKATGGVVQPVILKDRGDGTYLCVEGNTRVVIYQDLARETADGRWERIMAMVHDDLDERQAHEIRLQVHLVGPRPWPAYAKAKYLSELWHQDKMPMAEIIRVCGENEQHIKRDIDAYADMETFYRPVATGDGDGMFDPTKFSAFREMQRIKNDIHEASKDEKNFAEWVHQGKFHPINTIREFPKILRNNKAMAVFLKEGAKEAIKILDADAPEVDSTLSVQDASVQELAAALRKRIDRLSFEEAQRITKSPDSNEMSELTALSESMETLMDMLEED